MQIALFGGTFDPPHLGHQLVAQQMLARKIVDAVWFVPVKNHPFQKQMSPAQHRVAMLELMVSELPAVLRVEHYELHQPAVSYSFDTLMALSKKYSQHQLSFVIGTDNLPGFPKWHRYQELLQKFPVYVYPRQGFPPTPLQKGMIFLADFPKMAVSATQVRQVVHDRGVGALRATPLLVVPPVAVYIQQHHLYQTS